MGHWELGMGHWLLLKVISNQLLISAYLAIHLEADINQ
jgi:hypothetical protein